MSKGFHYLFISLLLALCLLEPALANKFETIGGGVSGGSAKKLAVLKEIALYAGGFFIFLGTMALLTRNRFEGLIGMRPTGKKKLGAVIIVPIALIMFGCTLLLLHWM